ncbi:MAG TPA: LysE family translocator [Solirubrobacteraceae bacterium]|jgi:threonine/homoserine/homoserine lactone efflux protein|nr:LysE family translocator [Solirubrobacteraceae bacterium]
MPSVHALVSFGLVAGALVVVPGPSVLFVVGRAVSAGRRTALASVVGNSLGISLQLALFVAGLGALIARSAALFDVLRVVGAAYLVLLGLRSIIGRGRVALGSAVARSTARSVREGFTVGATNPKGAIVFGALLTPFLDPHRGAIWLQVLVLGSMVIVFGLLTDTGWAMAAGRAREWLSRSPRRTESLGVVGGLMLTALGIHTALTGRRG